MSEINLLKLLTVLIALGYHTQILYYAQAFLSNQQTGWRWFPLIALVNTLLFCVFAWSDLPIYMGYILLLLFYTGELMLLFRPKAADLIFISGLFPFVLLCLRGVMIPLFALLYHTSMYHLMEMPIPYLLSLVISLVLCMGVLFLLRRHLTDIRLRLLLRCASQKRLVCTCLWLLLGYLIMECYVYYYDVPLLWTPIFHMVTSLVAFAAFYAVLWYAIDISAYIEYELKTRQVEKQLQRQVEHYRQYTKYVQDLREFKHDHKHMMETIGRLVAADAKQKALELLGQVDDAMENSLQYVRYSDQVVVDAILQECAGRCREKQITFSALVSLPERVGLNDLELCRMFGNLVDNAYEACAKMPQELPRFISLESSFSGGWVTVEISNSFSGVVELLDGQPVSQKADGTRHGLGLLSVRELTEHTGGFMRIEVDQLKQVFTVKLHLCSQL